MSAEVNSAGPPSGSAKNADHSTDSSRPVVAAVPSPSVPASSSSRLGPGVPSSFQPPPRVRSTPPDSSEHAEGGQQARPLFVPHKSGGGGAPLLQQHNAAATPVKHNAAANNAHPSPPQAAQSNQPGAASPAAAGSAFKSVPPASAGGAVTPAVSGAAASPMRGPVGTNSSHNSFASPQQQQQQQQQPGGGNFSSPPQHSPSNRQQQQQQQQQTQQQQQGQLSGGRGQQSPMGRSNSGSGNELYNRNAQQQGAGAGNPSGIMQGGAPQQQQQQQPRGPILGGQTNPQQQQQQQHPMARNGQQGQQQPQQPGQPMPFNPMLAQQALAAQQRPFLPNAAGLSPALAGMNAGGAGPNGLPAGNAPPAALNLAATGGLLPMQGGGQPGLLPQQQQQQPQQNAALLQQAMYSFQQQQQQQQQAQQNQLNAQQQLANLPPALAASLQQMHLSNQLTSMATSGGIDPRLIAAMAQQQAQQHFMQAQQQQQQQQQRAQQLFAQQGGMNRGMQGQPQAPQLNPVQMQMMMAAMAQQQQQQQQRHQLAGAQGANLGMQQQQQPGLSGPPLQQGGGPRPPFVGGAPGLVLPPGGGPTFPYPPGSMPQQRVAPSGMMGPGNNAGPNAAAPSFHSGVVNAHGATGGGLGPSRSMPNYLSNGGLAPTAGAGSGLVSVPPSSSAGPRVPPPPTPERKPLLITDDDGKPVDLSDLKKPEPAARKTSLVAVPISGAAASASASVSAASASPSASPALGSAAADQSARVSALDLSEPVRAPLAILTPTKSDDSRAQSYNAAAAQTTGAAAQAAKPAADAASAAAVKRSATDEQLKKTAEASASPSPAAAAQSSTLAPPSASASAPTPAAPAASSSSSSAATAAAAASPSPSVPAVPVRRAVMSLSPQPGVGSGLAPSASSESLAAMRASKNASPATAADKPSATTEAAEGDKTATGAASAASASSEDPKKLREPLLPPAPGSKAPYRPPTAAASAAGRGRSKDGSNADVAEPKPAAADAKRERAGSNPAAALPSSGSSSDLSRAAKAGSAAPSASPVSASSGFRMVHGRRIYDKDFLLSLSHLMSVPSDFPLHLQAEIDMSLKQHGTPGGRAQGSSPVQRQPKDADSEKQGMWTRGQTLPPVPASNAQDVRGRGGVASMTPQGGRNMFAQAGRSAVQADQQRSRDAGPSKSLGGGRDRDGRGERGGQPSRGGGGGGGRDDRRSGGGGGDRRDDRRGGGGDRGGQGQQVYLDGPIAPLSKSADRWLPGQNVSTTMDAVKKKVQGLLNKLALDKFDTLTHQLTDLIVENRSEGLALLNEVVSIIFDKALSEQFFSSMYADLCVAVSKAVAPIVEFEPELSNTPIEAPVDTKSLTDEEKQAVDEAAKKTQDRLNKKSPFRRMLLNKCQMEFEAGTSSVSADGLSADELLAKTSAQKRRFLGNIKFIGELFKKGMLIEKIMHACVAHLIGDMSNPLEEDLEAVCNLLGTIGKSLDHPKAAVHVNSYFDRFQTFSKNMKLSSRIRFMCLDLIDLRKSGWNSKRRPAEVKTLEAVRKEAAQEAQLKAQQSMLGQRGGGRGAPAPLSSFRPAGGMAGRAGAGGGASSGSQDVRGPNKSRDRYSAIKLPTTPVPSTPSTPVVTITSQMMQAKAGSSPASSPPAAAASSTAAQASYPVRKGSAAEAGPSASQAAPVSEEKAVSLIKSMISEYIESNDLNAARSAIEDLHSLDLYSLVVSGAVARVLSDSKHRARIADLVVLLFKDGVLTVDDLEQGLTAAFEKIDADFISDEMPKSPEFLGAMLAVWVEARCVDARILETAAAHLVESGDAIKIFIFAAKELLALRGEPSVARTLLEAGGGSQLALALLVQEDSEEDRIKECAREFARQPHMMQLYPTAAYASELRQAATAAAALTQLLGAHGADASQVNFLRSVVQSILLKNSSAELAALFTAVRSALPAAPSTEAQVGVLHTVASMLTASSDHDAASVLAALNQSGLVGDEAAQLFRSDVDNFDLRPPQAMMQ